MPRSANVNLNDLGFESVSSLIRALRVEPALFESVYASVESGYPYDCWYEQKRSGNGHRLIEHPHRDLKALQARINRLLQRLSLPRTFHGCYAGTSILSNASHHRKESWFLTFDLANYYKTIRPTKVYQGLVSYHAAPDV